MKLLAILAVGCAVCLSTAHAQTAKVIALDDKTAQHVKELYEQKARVEAEIAHVIRDIDDAYTKHDVTVPQTACFSVQSSNDSWSTCTPPKLTPEQEKASHQRWYFDGWENGFEFSDDFKYIVPKKRSVTYTASGLGCSYVTPATTTLTWGNSFTN
jgi:hypothetical protein